MSKKKRRRKKNQRFKQNIVPSRKFFIFSLVFNRSTCVVSFIVKWNLLSSLSRGRSGLSITEKKKEKKKIKKVSRQYRRNWCRNREISMVERYSRMNWKRWMPSIRSVTRGTPSRCTTKTLLSKNVSRGFRFFMILVWTKRWLVNLFACRRFDPLKKSLRERSKSEPFL